MPVIIVSDEITENVCSKPGSERRKWNQMVRWGYIGKIELVIQVMEAG